MTEQLRALQIAIEQYRAWADASLVPPDQQSGEWAAGYPGWAEIYTAFDAFVAASPCREWNDAIIELVLYAIARNDEFNYLIKSLARRSDDLLCLAEHAVTSPEWEAKWQIAAELGKLDSGDPQVETLLLRFAHDDEEYVRRRALLALADIGSPSVASLVDQAWNTGSEYQRANILYILRKMNSPRLAHYLMLAEADSRQYLVDYAARVRSGDPL